MKCQRSNLRNARSVPMVSGGEEMERKRCVSVKVANWEKLCDPRWCGRWRRALDLAVIRNTEKQ